MDSEQPQPLAPPLAPKIVVMPQEYSGQKSHAMVAPSESSVAFAKPKKVRSLRFIVISLIVLFVLSVILLGVWYGKGLLIVFQKNNEQNNSTAITAPQLTQGTSTSSVHVFESIVKDNQGRVVGGAKLSLDEDALPMRDVKNVGMIGFDKDTAKTLGIPDLERVVGGVFSPVPQDLKLSKVAQLELTYTDDPATTSLSIGYYSARSSVWNILPGQVNTIDKKGIVGLTEIPQGSYFAILMPNVPVLTDATSTPSLAETPMPSSKDSDNDGLTDTEELMYGTNVSNPDSDADTYNDGAEFRSLFNPLGGTGARLATSGLVNVYTDPLFHYQVFYPSSWLVRALDQSHKEVIFTSKTGELIEVLVQDNADKVDSATWLVRQSPGTDTNSLQRVSTPLGQALLSQDQMTAYISRGDQVYIVTYSTADLGEANFKTTFAMMLSSIAISQ